MNSLRIFFGFLIFTAILVWATQPSPKPAPEGHVKAPESPSGEESSRTTLRIATSAAAPLQPALARNALWERFREKYGHELEPQFSADGKLISIRGRPGQGRRSDGFAPDDPRKALARAREIVEGASELLGVTRDWPLERPVAKGSKVSAQVYFKEVSSDVAIAPFGNVWVDLDSQGGLLGLDSSYVASPSIVNSPTLDPSDAKLRALAAVSDGETALRVEGGDAVLWVEKDANGTSEARHALEYYVQGRQVIVDAASGAILHKRDVRQY